MNKNAERGGQLIRENTNLRVVWGIGGAFGTMVGLINVFNEHLLMKILGIVLLFVSLQFLAIAFDVFGGNYEVPETKKN